MDTTKNWFPYRQLEEAEKERILQYCGGLPPSPEFIRQFYGNHGLGALSDKSLQANLQQLAGRISYNLGADDAELKRQFIRGCLLYAGVLKELSPPSTLEFRRDVVSRAFNDDPVLLGINALSLLEEEAPSFCDIVEIARPALEAMRAPHHRATLIGAGVMHLVTTQSVLYNEIDCFELDHPELMDLQALFES